METRAYFVNVVESGTLKKRLVPKKGAIFNNYVIPQAMPHAIPHRLWTTSLTRLMFGRAHVSN